MIEASPDPDLTLGAEPLQPLDTPLIGTPVVRAMRILVPPIVIFAIMVLCAFASRANSLFDRPLALDEFHTLLVAGDPSAAHAWGSLKRGSDYNPPTLYILVKIFSFMTGRFDERSLRGFSFLSVYLGLVGVYVLLRGTPLKSVAMVGTLATMAHPLLILHTFDARFYGPWFAAASWYCVLLNKINTPRLKLGIVLATLLTSVLLCSIHYFGIISWTLITVAHLGLTASSWRRSLRDLLIVGPGPVALGVCVWIFYRGQRSAISVPTWVLKPSFSYIQEFLVTLFPALLFAIPGVVALLDPLTGKRSERFPASDAIERSSPSGLAGSLGLVFMPFAILGFTYLFQPATIPRYAMPTVVVVGPIVAFALRSIRPSMIVLTAIVFCQLALVNFGFCAAAYRKHESLDLLKAVQIVRADARLRASLLILSNQREIAYQVWRYAPEFQESVRIIHPSDLREGAITNFDQLERDVATRLNELYGTPGVLRLADLPTVGTIYLLTSRMNAESIAENLSGYQSDILYNQRVTCLRLSRK